MKRSRIYLMMFPVFALVSILLFVPNNSNAQVNCAWECDEGPWFPPGANWAMFYTSGIALTGHIECQDCEIRIFYKEREVVCPDETVQMQYDVRKITLTGCNGCYFLDGLIDLAMSHFVRAMITANGHPGVNKLVTFSMSTCWKGEWFIVSPQAPPEYRWEPCTEDCCRYEYMIYGKDSWPPLIIQTVNIPYTDCTIANDPECILACKMQGWLDKKGAEDNSIDMGRSHVFPNPSYGKSNINFSGENTGRFNIQIYNTNGQLLTSFDFIKHTYMVEFSFDLSGLSSGQYHYVITYNGIKQSDGILILNK